MPSIIKHCFVWREAGGLFGDFGEARAAVIFGQPVNRAWPTDALELQRLVRRDDFDRPLSEFVAWSLRWLKKHTETPFVLSYADSGQGHHGGIYQALSFDYVLESEPRQDGIRNTSSGEFIHGRQVGRMFGSQKRAEVSAQLTEDWELAYHESKFCYVRALKQRRTSLFKQFGWSALPYPKPALAA